MADNNAIIQVHWKRTPTEKDEPVKHILTIQET